MQLYVYICVYRRKFRSQTSDNMDRWKVEMGRVTEKRRLEERRSEKRKSQKKEDADARKGRNVARHCVFPMIWGSGGSKSKLAKAAGAEPAGQMRDEKVHAVVARSTFRSQNVQNTPAPDHFWKLRCRKKCTPLWREAHFEVKMYKAHQVRTTFGSWDVEKVHAVVARSTFRSQNVQNTPASDHFWKLRCRKSARRFGTKHISKWKCTKHYMFAPLLEVQMSKKCTPLWREAHFEVKMYKTLGVRTTFGGSDVASLHYTTLHYTTLHYITLQDITLQHYTPVHYITLHYTPVHSTTLNYTTPHYITLRSTTLHYITLHYTTLHYTTLHYTTLSSTTLHYLTLHYTPLHYNYSYNYTTTLHYTPLHSITLHYTTLHYTTLYSATLHYTTLHYTTLHYTEWHCTTDRQVDR